MFFFFGSPPVQNVGKRFFNLQIWSLFKRIPLSMVKKNIIPLKKITENNAQAYYTLFIVLKMVHGNHVFLISEGFPLISPRLGFVHVHETSHTRPSKYDSTIFVCLFTRSLRTETYLDPDGTRLEQNAQIRL